MSASIVNPYANARALTAEETATIKSTVPVLAEHGVTLTTLFYKKMFGKHPELKNVFNQAHQATGMQPAALAGAVYAYAANIDNLGALGAAVAHMAHKHVSLSILPEQYPIVGENLLITLDELLTSAGFARATVDTIIAAWGVAYGQLANILITEEEKLYQAAEKMPGGWRGWKKFKVDRKEEESNSCTSFYFVPVDGAALPAYQPGQYTTIRAVLPATDAEESFAQPRQYSLSSLSNEKYFRITVKREDAMEASKCPFAAIALKQGLKMCPAGRVSNMMHSTLEVGSEVELAPPCGEFFLNMDSKAPVCLLGAGVGLTPLVSMCDAARSSGRKVSFLYAAHDGASHPLKQWFKDQKSRADESFTSRVFYTCPGNKDVQGADFDEAGRLSVEKASEESLMLKDENTEYFVCGPTSFMKDMMAQLKTRGVSENRIHAEMFGSGSL